MVLTFVDSNLDIGQYYKGTSLDYVVYLVFKKSSIGSRIYFFMFFHVYHYSYFRFFYFLFSLFVFFFLFDDILCEWFCESTLWALVEFVRWYMKKHGWKSSWKDLRLIDIAVCNWNLQQIMCIAKTNRIRKFFVVCSQVFLVIVSTQLILD